MRVTARSETRTTSALCQQGSSSQVDSPTSHWGLIPLRSVGFWGHKGDSTVCGRDEAFRLSPEVAARVCNPEGLRTGTCRRTGTGQSRKLPRPPEPGRRWRRLLPCGLRPQEAQSWSQRVTAEGLGV